MRVYRKQQRAVSKITTVPDTSPASDELQCGVIEITELKKSNASQLLKGPPGQKSRHLQTNRSTKRTTPLPVQQPS